MFSFLNEIFIQFTSFTKTNPVVSGIVSLWGLGVVTFVFREVPNQVWEIILKQFTVRVIINCKDEAFYNIIKWYEDKGYGERSRTLRLNNGIHGFCETEQILSAGYGNHYFFFQGYPFRLNRSKEESGNSNFVKENIEIVTIGRSQQPIRNLLRASDPNIDSSKLTKVFKWDECYWQYSHDQIVRPLDSVTLDETNKLKLLSHLETFKNDKEWFLNHGVPYRTGICLYGPPGTGKTSLVRAICGLDHRDLYILNLNVISDKGLETAVDSLGKNAVLLIEDIDTFKATNNRAGKKSDHSDASTGLTLSGILNAIDGISTSDGRILVITTNKLDALDSALIRPGRIDLKLHLDYLNEKTVRKALVRFYPGIKLPSFRVKESLSPAELQNLVMQYKNEPFKVIEKISLHDIDQKVMSWRRV